MGSATHISTAHHSSPRVVWIINLISQRYTVCLMCKSCLYLPHRYSQKCSSWTCCTVSNVSKTGREKKSCSWNELTLFCVSCPSACLTGCAVRSVNEMACADFYRAGKEVSKRERGRKGSVNRRMIQAEIGPLQMLRKNSWTEILIWLNSVKLL